MHDVRVKFAVAALLLGAMWTPSVRGDVIILGGEEVILDALVDVVELEQVKVAIPRPALPPGAEEERKAAEIAALKAQLAQTEAVLAKLQAIAQEVKDPAEVIEQAKEAAKQIDVIKKKLAVVSGERTDEPKPEESPRKAEKSTDPNMIEFFLSDGTVLTGKLKVKSVDIETRFGRLTVPIEKIRRFKPGLESRPGVKERIAGYLEGLASDDAPTRKHAGEELLTFGPGIRDVLLPLAASTQDGPRAAELRTILSKLNEMAGPDDFNVDPNKIMSMKDVLETQDFTMTGSIVQKEFALATEYGSFALPLSAVVRAERDGGSEEMRAALTLTDNELAPRSFKSTGLRIEKGDVIQIRASGTLQMTRWGSNAVSTPEGAPNYGWYVN
ncbi:MAG: hypothetical protein WD768_10000, partial [Phycisphaeraceae bacterium]